MHMHRLPVGRAKPSWAMVLLLILLVTLWIAGGGSRANVPGQAVVRAISTLCLVLFCLTGPLVFDTRTRPAMIVLITSGLIALLQLMPLPPVIWTTLPGRAPFLTAARLASEPQPWRPLAIVPSMTLNALLSLIVPFTVLCLMNGIHRREDSLLIKTLLGFVLVSALAGLLQFSGGASNNPLLNGVGEISGNFANHNHFALLLAIGCVLAPAWAFRDGRQSGWRAPVVLGLILVFTLTILASGSRAGTALGIIALGLALLLAWRPLRRTLTRYPRWVFPALIGGTIALIALAVVLSIANDRAMSIDRAMTVDVHDMRSKGLPVVLRMIHEYFPVGAGLGGFDPLFRMHEPFTLLKPTYFNHAHNDFLEIVLDTGVVGVIALLAAITWWLMASLRAWRSLGDQEGTLARLGSAMLLLVLLASVVDYPARTPIIMAVVTIAAVWLGGQTSPHQGAKSETLPQSSGVV
jgi:O-antigen ligase